MFSFTTAHCVQVRTNKSLTAHVAAKRKMFSVLSFSESLLIKSVANIHLSVYSRFSNKSFAAEDVFIDSKQDRNDQKWTKSPYKIKQLRFSKHIINLVHKGKVSEAVEVFESMRSNKVKPDAVVYNALIAGYGRAGNVEASFKVFNQVSHSYYTAGNVLLL